MQRSNHRAGRSAAGSVLVSGAGFAGLATAFWLVRLGYSVTVIDAAGGLRRGGTPVDLEGETVAILDRMGVRAAVLAKALPPRSLRFKDADDSTIGEFPAEPALGVERCEVHRDDLLDILSGALGTAAALRFGRSLARLAQDGSGVTATFDDGSEAVYDLVFGCDGSRSNTRRLAFPEEGECLHSLGGYFALKVVRDLSLLPADTSHIFSVPGRTALLNGYRDRADIGLAFRSAHPVAYDHRDRAHQRRLIHEHCGTMGWKVPAMLAHLDADDAFYFDRLVQIRMRRWSAGRVVLVGDAGYCVSPVAGMGGSMAVIGAARLGDALARHRGDHAAAFAAYEGKLRPFVTEVQERAAGTGMSMMFPSDAAELAERDRRLGEGMLSL